MDRDAPAVDVNGDLIEVPEDLVTECRHAWAHHTEENIGAGGLREVWVVCSECDQPLFLLS